MTKWKHATHNEWMSGVSKKMDQNVSTKHKVTGQNPGMWVASTFMDGEFSNLTIHLGADAEDWGSHGVSKKWSRITC